MTENDDATRRSFLRAPISGSGFAFGASAAPSTPVEVDAPKETSNGTTSKMNLLLRPSALTATAEKLRTDKAEAAATVASKLGESDGSESDEKSAGSKEKNGSGETKVLGHLMRPFLNETVAGDKNDFIFGQDISSRVVNAEAGVVDKESEIPEEFKDIASSMNDASKNDSSSSAEVTPSKTLQESAQEYQQKLTKPDYEEVEVITGEEEESNVLHLWCKAFVFDKDQSKWMERGRGYIRLNDCPANAGLTGNDQHATMKSRLIMRVQGSLKVILNTFVWAEMVVDLACEKSLRLQAQTEDGLHMFLLMMHSAADASLLQSALTARKLKLQQEEAHEGATSGKATSPQTSKSPRKRPAAQEEVSNSYPSSSHSSLSAKRPRDEESTSNSSDTSTVSSSNVLHPSANS